MDGEINWLRLVILAFATWRLTHLLAYEDGPADSLYKLRKLLGERFFGKLLDCFYCLSLWIAAVAACFLRPVWSRDWPMIWLALSGAACLLERQAGRAIEIKTIPTLENDDELLRQEA